MRRLHALAAGVVAATMIPASANAAEVAYGFIATPIGGSGGTSDAAQYVDHPFSGSFRFDTSTNSLLSFDFYPLGPVSYGSFPSGLTINPYDVLLPLFQAAGPCDITCFIGAINSSTYLLEVPVERVTLNFGGPIDATIVGRGGSGAGRQASAAGTLSITGQIPEPTTWALILLGFGGIGLAMRRERASKIRVRTHLAEAS